MKTKFIFNAFLSLAFLGGSISTSNAAFKSGCPNTISVKDLKKIAQSGSSGYALKKLFVTKTVPFKLAHSDFATSINSLTSKEVKLKESTFASDEDKRRPIWQCHYVGDAKVISLESVPGSQVIAAYKELGFKATSFMEFPFENVRTHYLDAVEQYGDPVGGASKYNKPLLVVKKYLGVS